LNDEIIFAIQYQTGNTQESQGFSAEFTSTVRQGRQDGLNLANPNLVADFTVFGGNRTEVSFVTFGSKNEVTNADVLLLHAEAILAGGGQTSSGAAIESYMAVRTRAGFDPGTRPAALTSGDLLVERRVELAFENHRFYDLLRFGVADAVLGAHAAENGFTDYDARKLLLPIPSREINLSRGILTQNPGY